MAARKFGVFKVPFPKTKVDQVLRERTVESFLDFSILSMLTKNPLMSADDLINYIHQKLGVSLSLGILYSHLSYLEREGLIQRTNVKNKKVYKVTLKAKEKIAMAKKHKSAIQWIIDQMF